MLGAGTLKCLTKKIPELAINKNIDPVINGLWFFGHIYEIIICYKTMERIQK